ncbi:protein O-mannosyl-transferase family [candidate division CSSED10-310 bacterium]|uniref:Protein O-mannosyl-transferase family n=1 Tax=candidate division CSSED10-310 bacterium TaxID=2855610 RepID=A0ABV6YWJ1_UNCC1
MMIKNKLISAPLLFFIFAGLFFFLKPGLNSGEGPLLTTAAYHLGISHPPGYPLYLHIAKSGTLLPFGNIAFRLNILSLLIGLVALSLYPLISRALSRSPGFCGLLLFFLTPTFLENILKTEVYALNVLFFQLFLLSWLQWDKTSEVRWLFLLCFLFGLSLGHHLTLILACPIFIVFAFIQRRETVLRFSPLLILFFIFGSSILLYLPIRAGGTPLINWGHPDSARAFMTLITAQEEAMPSFLDTFREIDVFQAIFGNLLTLLRREFILPLLLLSLFGWLITLRLRRNVTLLLTFIFLTLSLAVALYHSFESNAFLLPGFLILTYWIDSGLYKLYLEIKDRLTGQQILKKYLYLILALGLICGLCFFQLGQSTQSPGIYQSFDLEWFSRGMLTETDNEAYIFTERSNLYFLLLYQQYLENVGQDRYVVFIHLLSFPWFLTKQFGGELPLEPFFDIEKHAQNTALWNETIAAALINVGWKNTASYLIEPEVFQQKVKKHFPHLHLQPGGFHFQVKGQNIVYKQFTAYYKWFVQLCLTEPLDPLNRDMYTYFHSVQGQVLLEQGILAPAQQESDWRNRLLAKK